MTDWLDTNFTIGLLRRLVAGKRLAQAQLEHLEEGGFICTTDDGQHHLTTHGAQTLKKGL